MKWCAIALSLIGAGCLTPPHLRQREEQAKYALSDIAPVVSESLDIPLNRIPDIVVVPAGALSDDTGGAFDHDRIFVASRCKIPLTEIVAREFVRFLLHSHYPSLPYLIEEGVAHAIAAEISGTTGDRLIQAIFRVREDQAISCTFDLAQWEVHATIPAEGDLSVSWFSDHASLETTPHEERRLLRARSFLTIRALMNEDETSDDDLIPSLVRRLTPSNLGSIGDPCTRPCGKPRRSSESGQ